MAFSAVPRKTTGDLWSDADHSTYLRDNMYEGIPGKFTAKGQLLAASGSQACALLSAGANGTALGYDSAESAGLKWYGGTLPLGMIILWSGAVGSIPSGWQICDGTNGTPDLRDRFLVGAGSTYAVGASGGGVNLQHAHTPNAANTDSGGSHTHAQDATYLESAHTHPISGTITTGGPSATVNQDTSGSSYNMASNSHTHTISGNTDGVYGLAHWHTNPNTNSGGSHSHSLSNLANALNTSYLPPYYALAYIQRVS